LLVVLVTLAVMGALSTEFAYNTRTNIWMSGHIRADTQAYYHARSATRIATLAVNAKKNFPLVKSAMALMGKSRNSSQQEIWRQACAFVEIFATGQASLFGLNILDLSEEDAVGVSAGGSFRCEVTSEDSRVNLNAAAGELPTLDDTLTDPRAGGANSRGAQSTRGGKGANNARGRRAFNPQRARNQLGLQLYGLFRPMLDSGQFDSEEEMFDLMLNIMDWTDADEDKTDIDEMGQFVDAGGGESVDYGQYGYDYKNSKMDTVGEVQLIEGMTSDIYCQLRDKMTVFATDKVNINDADLLVLKGVLCQSIEDEMARMEYCWGSIPGVPPPIDSALLTMNTCRDVKKQLYSKPYSSFGKFRSFFQNWPNIDPTGSTGPLPINWRTVQQNLGTNTRMVRIEAVGEYRFAQRKITTIIDTSNGYLVYSHSE